MADASETWVFAQCLSKRVEELVSSAMGAHQQPWLAVLASQGLQPTAASESPIPAPQVEAVLTQVVAEARTELAAIDRAADLRRDVLKALFMRLDRLVEVETERYREATADAAKPKPPGGGLGAIFANAKATAAMSPWARAERWKQQVTLTCKSCGAPQRESRNFQCAYCAGDLFRRPYDDM